MTTVQARQFRNEPYRAANRRIISVDGEGQTYHERHAYTLLAAADDRGFKRWISHDGVIRPARISESWYAERVYGPGDMAANHGLPTRDCLEFLLDLREHKSDLILSFSFTYDVTKILQDLPYFHLVEFATTGATEWEGYKLRGLPRKFFEVTRGERRCVVYDTFAYWQMSFVRALNSSLNLFDDEQRQVIDFITQMKLERAELERQTPEDILRYCLSECQYLSILYRDLLIHCEQMGLLPYAHSGPGSLADEFFSQERINGYQPQTGMFSICGMPPEVAIHSYYGGRFETAYIGNVGDLIEYDIQSAYPATAVRLPCFCNGRFERVTEFVPGKWGFYFVGSRTSGPWAPFPFRIGKDTRDLANGASKGSIVFGHGGRRWAGSPEVEIAIKHFGSEAIPVYDGWVYTPGCNHQPFKRIAELYLLRKVGNPHCPDCNASPDLFCAEHPSPSEGLRKIVKLLINSIYGKLAQSIGAHKYQCFAWAAWITSATRAQVLDAALLATNWETGESDVIAIATDGILSRKDIPALHVTKYELGTWERTPKKDAWLGMPGIYAFGRDPDNDKAFKRRGLDRKYFPALYMRKRWEAGAWEVEPIEDIRAFMPLKLAVMRTAALDVLGEWITQPKRVKFRSVEHKRDIDPAIDPFMPHDGTSVRLYPPVLPDDVRSEPYKLKAEHSIRDLIGDLDMPMWDDDTVDSEQSIAQMMGD